MGTNHGFHRILLRASLPFHRGLEERPAARSGRIDRRSVGPALARALPAAVTEIRRVHGDQPFTLVFDRGGYSGDAFRFLQAEGIGFLTYFEGPERASAVSGQAVSWRLVL